MKYVWYYAGLVVVSALSAWLVYIYAPHHRVFLLEEDGLIENLSAFFFLLTFVVAFVLGITGKGKTRPLLLVSLIGLLGFLDELSYGERLFSLSLPFVDGMKVDSLHDLYELTYFQFVKLVPAYTIPLYLLLTAVVAGLLILLFIRTEPLWRDLAGLRTSSSHILILLVGLCLLSALVIDFVGASSVRGFRVPALTYGTLLEELLEMSVGMGLFFCSLSLYDSAVEKTADTLTAGQLWTGTGAVTFALLGVGLVTWHLGEFYQETTTFEWDNDIDSTRSWEFYYVQGNVLADRGELEEAMDHYREALKLKPGNAAIHFDLGNALVRASRLDEAADQFREVLRVKPDFADAYYHLGKILGAQGDLEQAIGHYRSALRMQPEFADAHEGLGRALTQQGKPDEALKHYEQAVRLIKLRGDSTADR